MITTNTNRQRILKTTGFLGHRPYPDVVYEDGCSLEEFIQLNIDEVMKRRWRHLFGKRKRIRKKKAKRWLRRMFLPMVMSESIRATLNRPSLARMVLPAIEV